MYLQINVTIVVIVVVPKKKKNHLHTKITFLTRICCLLPRRETRAYLGLETAALYRHVLYVTIKPDQLYFTNYELRFTTTTKNTRMKIFRMLGFFIYDIIRLQWRFDT